MMCGSGGDNSSSDMGGAMARGKNALRINLIVPLSLLLVVACASKVAVIGSPYDRYDHNRQQKIEATLAGKTCAVSKRALADEIYTPYGSPYFPSVLTDENTGGDKLPAANIVPVFTGISLPLSSVARNGVESDKMDLIDYLSAGPTSKDGVERTAMAGDTKTTEKAYAPIITFLESRERLSEGKGVIIRSLSQWETDFAKEIIDSRYSLGSFQDVLAIEYKDYWFILFKLPGNEHYSRLVVAPLKMKGQDFSAKRP